MIADPQGEPSSVVPEPSTEDWDNRDDEVNGETRGFVSCGRCSWSMSRGLFADLHEHERTHESEPQGEPSDANAGEGWFEWFKMPENTTEIAYVHENGEVFDPQRGWNPIEFTIAAAEGRVHRLVRAVTEQGENR